MAEDELTELVKRLRTEGENKLRKDLSLGMHDLCFQAAATIESLRASLANAEKEIADLKYRLEAAREFADVSNELPGEAIEKMKEIVRNIVLHRKVKK
jgi:hypothetical protein